MLFPMRRTIYSLGKERTFSVSHFPSPFDLAVKSFRFSIYSPGRDALPLNFIEQFKQRIHTTEKILQRQPRWDNNQGRPESRDTIGLKQLTGHDKGIHTLITRRAALFASRKGLSTEDAPFSRVGYM